MIGGYIEFNRTFNWSLPNQSFVLDQNGAQLSHNQPANLARSVGQLTMTNDQFVDLIILHELGHIFGLTHPDQRAYDTNIWRHCF